MHQHLNMSERKWQQPWLQLHLVTKCRGRRELGLPTSSAAVLPLKTMPCLMFWSIQTFSVNGNFTECYDIFCFCFIIFVCWCYRYRPWAAIRLLHHFGFVTCVNSRLYCTHFSCHWRKIRNVSGRLTQISERQRDPCFNFSYYLLLNAISWLRYAFCACRPSGEIAIAIIEPHSLLWIQSIAQVQYNCPRWQWCCRLICRLPTHNGQESQGRNVWLWTECSEEIPRGESVDKLCVSVSSFLAITWTDKVI